MADSGWLVGLLTAKWPALAGMGMTVAAVGSRIARLLKKRRLVREVEKLTRENHGRKITRSLVTTGVLGAVGILGFSYALARSPQALPAQSPSPQSRHRIGESELARVASTLRSTLNRRSEPMVQCLTETGALPGADDGSARAAFLCVALRDQGREWSVWLRGGARPAWREVDRCAERVYEGAPLALPFEMPASDQMSEFCVAWSVRREWQQRHERYLPVVRVERIQTGSCWGTPGGELP